MRIDCRPLVDGTPFIAGLGITNYPVSEGIKCAIVSLVPRHCYV